MINPNMILRKGEFFADHKASSEFCLLYVGDGQTPFSQLNPVGNMPSLILPPNDGQVYGMKDGMWVPQVWLGDIDVGGSYGGDPGTNNGPFTVTFNLNGGIHTGGGALIQTVSLGGSATAPTKTKVG
jgi:hypothetical protein